MGQAGRRLLSVAPIKHRELTFVGARWGTQRAGAHRTSLSSPSGVAPRWARPRAAVADDRTYIAKPFTRAELADSIRALLPRALDTRPPRGL
jgi:hypothetical protein